MEIRELWRLTPLLGDCFYFVEIYILRHAVAVPHEESSSEEDRPLTEEGVRKMFREARGISKVVPSFETILTSPLVRAKETAEIVAQALAIEDRLEICKELIPGASLENLFSTLANYKHEKRVLLVGHEPQLSLVASSLLGCREPMIVFKKGSLCRIDAEVPGKGSGKLKWHMTPRQLRALA